MKNIDRIVEHLVCIEYMLLLNTYIFIVQNWDEEDEKYVFETMYGIKKTEDDSINKNKIAELTATIEKRYKNTFIWSNLKEQDK